MRLDLTILRCAVIAGLLIGGISSTKSSPEKAPEWKSDLIVGDDVCKAERPDYRAHLQNRIKQHWRPPIAAWKGEQGAIYVHFNIGADGKAKDVTTVNQQGSDSLEKAARKAVLRASPFEKPLFAGANCDRMSVTIGFFYNMSDQQQKELLKEAAEQDRH